MVVSAIGAHPEAVDASRVALDTPARLLMDSTAQGLVRFDATGQIEPGIAERWIVIDGGMSYIFRLREGDWGDGTPVTAEQVVAMLRRQIGGPDTARAAAGARNPLAPFLTAIDEIVVMTPQVIEVRLSRPRPDLLKLFAQPELALLRLRPTGGTGPFRVAHRGRAPLLRPAFDPGQADPDDQREDPQTMASLCAVAERAKRTLSKLNQTTLTCTHNGKVLSVPLTVRGAPI